MRVLSIVHQRDCGAGVFLDTLAERGVQHDEWLIAEQREPPADPFGYDAVITCGGAMNVDQESEHDWLGPEKQLLADLLDAGRPQLAVCLGSQLLAEAAGAEPGRASEPEIGWKGVEVTPEGVDDPLLAPLAPRFTAFQWHSYAAPLPPGAVALARSPICLQAYRIGANAYGIQFHAEVTAADAEKWTEEWQEDPDAVKIGLDPNALRKDTAAAIGSWNELGRGLCERFLAAVVP